MTPPRFLTCLVAEDIRQETGSKLTILGFFGVSPVPNILVPAFPAALRLALIFWGEPTLENVTLGLRIKAPTGKTLLSFADKLVLKQAANPASPTILNVRLDRIPIDGAGTYAVELLHQGIVHFRAEFTVSASASYEAGAKPQGG
jgi:hypothetical protein